MRNKYNFIISTLFILLFSFVFVTIKAQEKPNKFIVKFDKLCEKKKYEKLVRKVKKLKSKKKKNEPKTYVQNFYMSKGYYGWHLQSNEEKLLAKSLKYLVYASKRDRLKELLLLDSGFVKELKLAATHQGEWFYGQFNKRKSKYYFQMLNKVFPDTSIFYYALYDPENTWKYSSSTRPNDTLIFPIIFLEKVNKLRKEGCQCGEVYMEKVEPVQWSYGLARVARMHSVDMMENQYFSHQSLDGRSPFERARQNGVRGACGENIHAGSYSETGAFEGWKNSPGHCRNMMNPNARFIGLGRGGKYWTMLIGY